MTHGEPPPLALAGVSFAFPQARADVVHDVSLEVHRGEFVGVLGPNGAGKSTLLRLLAGLHAPRTGTVTLDGHDLSSLTRGAVARRVAVVPQQEASAFDFTVRQAVAMGRAPHTGLLGTLRAADREAVDLALAQCEAMHLADRIVAELSGGEQKRVFIARAMAQATPILLLDEPVAFLDIKHQLAVCDLLARTVATGDRTAVAVLHDLNLAAQYCSRLLFLREGRVQAYGPVSDVMTYQRIRDTFDAEVYVGQNEINDTRFFVPMRPRSKR